MLWRHFKKARKTNLRAVEQRAGVIFLTVGVLLSSACMVARRYSSGATSNQLELKATLLMPEVKQKLPISVGLYYSPEFANHRQQWIWDVRLEPPSVQLFDQASRSLFATVIPVSGRPPLGESLVIDGVLEPHIEAFEIQDLAALGGGRVGVGNVEFDWAYQFLARIRYRLVLYDRSGASIASWVVIGDAAMLIPSTTEGYIAAPPRSAPVPLVTVDYVAVLIDAALQDAMRQFVDGFDRNPEVIQWLARKKVQ